MQAPPSASTHPLARVRMMLCAVYIQDFARLNFIYTLLSKRKLTWFVDNKYVDGWHDPRFPTVQGMLRRGLTVPALREFILAQGASKRQIEMEWDKFWVTNKKHVDPVAPRFTALVADKIVTVQLTNGPEEAFVKPQPLHPKNADVGMKSVYYTSSILVEQVDAAGMKEGEEITLMKWGNAIVRKVCPRTLCLPPSLLCGACTRYMNTHAAHVCVHRLQIERADDGTVLSIVADLHLEGDVKKTEKKVSWLPNSSDNVPFTMAEFDYLIKVPNLLEGDDFMAAIVF
ncbi:MAG: hypothetical protein EOO65_00445 [Methanosarcinales archaeon]|nr:MAG: hypothetical protein EOO65_00445 [Methanosarcinales archaeon]